jgi:hypothetical protein
LGESGSRCPVAAWGAWSSQASSGAQPRWQDMSSVLLVLSTCGAVQPPGGQRRLSVAAAAPSLGYPRCPVAGDGMPWAGFGRGDRRLVGADLPR